MRLLKTASLCLSAFFFFLFFIHTDLLSQGNDPVENAGRALTPLEKYIHELGQQVVDQHKTTDKLSQNDLADLPLGIARQIGNYQYVIAIDSAYWNGAGWFFSAYASIKFPGASRPLAFRAEKVGFNKTGLASLTKTKLILAAPQWITLSDDIVMELPADGSNSIVFDCNGFQSINLKGNFHFTSDRIVPDADVKNTTGTQDKNVSTDTPAAASSKYVMASFELSATDLSNLMTDVSITPFRIKGLDDISFEVKKATVDYSDYSNPTGFSFPTDYKQSYGDSPSLWRGFYLQEVDVKIKGISNDEKKPLTLQAKNLLIDDSGVSGAFTGSNLLTLDKGSADGWPLAVNSLSVTLLQNNLHGGAMAGDLIIPFLGKDPLAYSAELAEAEGHLNYKFTVGIDGKREFTAPFSAKVTLTQAIVALEKKDNHLVPSATLSGSIMIKEAGGKVETGLKFENFGLTTRSPYIVSGNFSTVGDSQSKSAGFPIRIDSVNLKIAQGQVALGVGFALNFMDSGDKGFSARAHVTVSAKVEKETNSDSTKSPQENWKFDGIKLNDISLDCKTTAFSVKGRLTFFENDAVYGNGFRGTLNMSIQNVLDGVQVNGYFGRTEKDGKDGYRYWHLDAYVPMGPTGIPITPALSIKGIIGGASYKMSRKNPAPPDFTKLDAKDQPTVTSNNKGSGFDFIPDGTAGYSFMAGVTLIMTSNAKSFNSDAVLEVALNENGGLRYVEFKGSAYFMVSIEERGRSTDSGPAKAPLYATMDVMYDNVNQTFHANMKAYLNLKDKIRGTGPNDMMGDVVMHFGKGEYYIWLGHPTQMLGVDIASLSVAQSYFMAGNKMEDLPPPPPEMREVAGDRDMSMVKDANALAGGRGFAMGSRFQMGYDSKNNLRPFYVVLTMGAGFDVLIRDFGDATCAGSDGQIGFHGWYASGQAFVYLKGKIGLQAHGHRFDILNLGLAALLQAKLPNPTWLKGELAVKYSVLGGFVSGTYHYKMVYGEQCEIVTPGSELGNITVISDVTPSGNDVNVFTSPQVSFNTAIDTEFSMLNTNDETNSYRAKLDEFSVSNNGQPIQATFEWNGKRDVLALHLSETLPQKATLKTAVKLHWEKKLPNGSWDPLKDDNNAISYETKEFTFTTGEAPNFIPDENVVYSYPIKHQYNLLPQETNQGYVKLRYGQSYLFQPSDDNIKWTYLARFEQPSGNKLEVPLSYNNGQATVNFSIPDALVKQSVYKLTFIKRPETQGGVDSNLERKTVAVDGGDAGQVNVASNTLTGNLTQDVEKVIYNSAFRTSQFNNFSEKWASISGSQDLFDIAVGNVAVIGKGVNLSETFDDFELKGFQNHNKPLVQVSASSEDSWLKNIMAPLLYDSYPADPSVTITNRSIDSLGVEPLRAVRLTNSQGNYILEDANITSGTAPAKSGPVKVMYYLSYVGLKDFSELRDKAASQLLRGNTSPGVMHLLSARGYTDLTPGTYRVNFSYTLPGTNQVTTEKQIAIQF